jgi:glycosyltransferase involved in cell wall biosynthesis
MWSLHDKFVVGYSGNLGRAHEFGTVLGAAEQLRDDPRILFLMIGGGKHFDELATSVKERRLESMFRFVPYQRRTILKYSLATPDVHWISLIPELEGLIVPSKFYGVAAAGKPLIVIAAKDGEPARLVQEHSCGVVIEPGDADALACTLLRLSNDPGSLTEMGMRARKMLEAHFTRKKGFERWRQLLDTLD